MHDVVPVYIPEMLLDVFNPIFKGKLIVKSDKKIQVNTLPKGAYIL